MRPIDADAYAAELWKLRENYQMLDDTYTADRIMHGIYRAEQALKEQPTLDVAPVGHGEWIQHGNVDEGFQFFLCSNCNAVGHPIFHHCPNCGAKMDGKEQDDGNDI